MKLRSITLGAILVAASLLGFGHPAMAFESYIYGTAYDANTLVPLANVCVVLGPALVNCVTHTDANGKYFVQFPDNDAITADQELHFLNRAAGYQDYNSPHFKVQGATFEPAPMLMVGANPPPVCDTPGTPTKSIYLPNITRYLGGPTGWYTPFIVQNTGTVATVLEVSFYKFSDGSLIVCRKIGNLLPGTSFADVPNNDLDLPFDSQFAVVVRSFGSTVVSVVNEHGGSGVRAEAMSYDGASAGGVSVFLPNITRRFFGFDTPFIIQNLGTVATSATARFVSFDGSVPVVTSLRTIDPGRSQFIDPNYEPGLVDGHQYAVTVTSPTQPISVVINTQDDQPASAAPKAYSTNGIIGGAATLYGAYASKHAAGIDRSATIVVQNMGTATATPAIAFTPLGGGTPQGFVMAPIQPGGSGVFDMRYTNGDTLQPFCSSPQLPQCLPDGEFSFTVAALGASLAAQVNVISPATAMGYSAAATPSTRVWMPNTTRTLGGATGWSTPVIIQSVTATSMKLSWYRFSDGVLVTTQTLPFTQVGMALRIDPRDVAALSDGTQYSVVADGIGGTIVGIVTELNFQGGDGAMIYEGFSAP
jgi:hypothetical protein